MCVREAALWDGCCHCCLCSWQGKENGEKGIVRGMDHGQGSGDWDGAHRALPRAAILVLSKTAPEGKEQTVLLW